ncbi:hypothetical protein AB0F25_10080 [Streptomyces wedmorensis]
MDGVDRQGRGTGEQLRRDGPAGEREDQVDLLALPSRVEEAAERVERVLGPIDVWANTVSPSVSPAPRT